MSDKKALIVLVVDHDTYTAEAAPPDFPLDNKVLMSFGQEANYMAAHWLGYEAWMVIADVPEPLLNELGKLNLPLEDG